MPKQRLKDLIALADKIEIPVFIVEVRSEDDLIFRSLNSYHEKVTGMSGAALAGKTPHDILPKRMADSLMAKYLTCVHSRAPFSYEEVLELPKGELWLQTTLSPIFFDDGSIIGIFGTAVDITARKQQEFRDAKALAELRQLNEEINMYTSMVAHDVRGPLRKIKVIHELMMADAQTHSDGSVTLREDQVALLNDVGTITASALEHVDSILSYSRALDLSSQPVLEEIDLRLLCSDLVSLVDADKRIEIQYPQQNVRSEKIILQVVLRNLLENAVKFGDSACVVEVTPSEDDDDRLVFTTSDDGQGFHQGHMFEERSATSRLKSATTGFGLASAQRMVEARGGRMWLAPSKLGSGASVSFSVPGSLV